MPSSNNANWQLLLYLFRLIFLIPLTILWFWGYFRKRNQDMAISRHSTKHLDLWMDGHWLVFLIPVGWTCINDVYMYGADSGIQNAADEDFISG